MHHQLAPGCIDCQTAHSLHFLIFFCELLVPRPLSIVYVNPADVNVLVADGATDFKVAAFDESRRKDCLVIIDGDGAGVAIHFLFRPLDHLWEALTIEAGRRGNGTRLRCRDTEHDERSRQ